jgi:transposase-like protein
LDELRAQWRQRVADFRASGLSGAAWCAAHQLKEHQLWYWVRRFADETSSQTHVSPVRFLPVEVRESTSPSQHPLIVRVGQAAIEVHPGFDPSLLRDVVRSLSGV